MVTANMPVSEEMLDKFKTETRNDPVLQKLGKVVREGWPDQKVFVPNEIQPYFLFRHEITECE